MVDPGPGGQSRVARRRQRVLERKRARARRAAVAAGVAGLVAICGMVGMALSTSHPSARALTADGAPDPGRSPASITSSSDIPPSASTASLATSSASSPESAAISASSAGSDAVPQSNSLAAAGPAGTVPAVESTAQQSAPPAAKPFGGTPAVGVLFKAGSGVDSHFCSASVVHSAAGNLVITAAHCVYSDGPKQNIAFAPGYHDGKTPYGTWNVTRVLVSDSWQKSNDQDQDVAFLQVAASSSGASLESVTGADQIAFDRGFGMPVTVPAYAQGSDTPITCVAPALKHSSTQTEWDCRGYPDGTSGAPFLVDVDAGGLKGTVVGVIGGYQQGGLTPDVSYSCYFGSAIQALYQSASS